PHTYPLSLHDALPISIREHDHAPRVRSRGAAVGTPVRPIRKEARDAPWRQVELYRQAEAAGRAHRGGLREEGRQREDRGEAGVGDRKSTRLNSSHVSI